MPDELYQSRPGRTYQPRKVADDEYDIATLFETVRRCNIDMLREANNIRQLNASIYTWRSERAEALQQLQKWLEYELANDPGE